MEIKLRLVQLEDKEILANLIEKYDYEFSQYDNRDVNKLGLYGYRYLDYYWNEENRWAYFIEVDGNLAGFVMVTPFAVMEGTETDFQMAEFFVMYKYRCLGVGRQAFFQALNKHRGKWQLVRHPKNIASIHFWENVIDEYTKGQYRFVSSSEYSKWVYPDGSLGDAFFFES